jgi:hypothetical protein
MDWACTCTILVVEDEDLFFLRMLPVWRIVVECPSQLLLQRTDLSDRGDSDNMSLYRWLDYGE